MADSILVRESPIGAERQLMPNEVFNPLMNLRRQSYRPGMGTWFTLDLVVQHDGTISTAENRLDEPDNLDTLPGSLFAQDLVDFPRVASELPEWLQRKATEQDEPEPPIATPDWEAAEASFRRQADLVSSVASLMIAAPKVAPSGTAESLNLLFGAAGGRVDITLAELTEEDYYVLEHPPGVREALLELRDACYRPGVGTWFSGVLTVEENGQPYANYNYNNEPPDLDDFADELFVRDLRA